MWEYERKDIKFRLYSEINEILNEMGGDRWEVISYNEISTKNSDTIIAKILFKRKLVI